MTAGLGIEKKLAEFAAQHDDYRAIMLKTLADRLAEAAAEWLHRANAPTALFYGHYDVQPADPLDLWLSPAFEPTERDGNLFARGSVDDKGQIYIHFQAIASYLRHGGLPINLKIILEGEEEIGSPNLMPFVKDHRDDLACDIVLISDTSMMAKGLPTLSYGLRGLSYVEIRLRSADTDLHSGQFGGAVPNAINSLVDLLHQLKDDEGRITVPGFYDDVIPLTSDERKRYAALPFDEAEFRESIGISETPGEDGYTVLERLWARPTLDINGIWGGWTGAGAKTVIPAEAFAKVSMRLVPDQDPERTFELFADHIQRITPPGCVVEVVDLHGGLPFLAPVNSAVFQAAERALEKAFGTKVARARQGGSIPFVPAVTRALEVPAILMGFGHPEENAHAPNEHLYLEHFFSGIKAVAYLYDELAKG